MMFLILVVYEFTCGCLNKGFELWLWTDVQPFVETSYVYSNTGWLDEENSKM